MPETLEYRPRGAALKLFHCRDFEVLLEGPAGVGKTKACLELANLHAELYPGCRILFLRQVKADLAESILVTWEGRVLWQRHPAIQGTASRQHREVYLYPYAENEIDGRVYRGRTEVVCSGLDRPERTFSAEYDFVFGFEGIEISLDAWEKLIRVTRNFHAPYQQMILDTNPGSERHWANLRADQPYEVPAELRGMLPEPRPGQKQMTRLISRHKDNPFLWDYVGERWTGEGVQYMSGLHRLTGTRRRRLLDGAWVSEEGQIFDTYDPSVHRKPRSFVHLSAQDPLAAEDAKEVRWTFMSMDFGSRNPGCLHVWGVDGENRLYRLAEVYRRGQIPSWWADRIVELWKEFDPRSGVADCAELGSINQLNARMMEEGRDGPPFWHGSDKSRGKVHGINQVLDLLALREDGLPGIIFLEDALRFGRDEGLVEDGKPCSFEEEVPAYVWEKRVDGRPDKERPDPTCADHAIDSAIYAAVWFWGRDMADPEPKEPAYPPGSVGHMIDTLRSANRPKRRR